MPLNSTRGAGSSKGFGWSGGKKIDPIDFDYLVLAGGGAGGFSGGGGGGTPAGSDRQVQFNDAGAFGAADSLIYQNGYLTVGSATAAGGIVIKSANTLEFTLTSSATMASNSFELPSTTGTPGQGFIINETVSALEFTEVITRGKAVALFQGIGVI